MIDQRRHWIRYQLSDVEGGLMKGFGLRQPASLLRSETIVVDIERDGLDATAEASYDINETVPVNGYKPRLDSINSE